MNFKRFTRNTVGRDLIVGDVHGNFSKLQRALDAAGFDPQRDRLFSVGDLVDRGPESELAVEWLAKPWFHAVRGNHEQMAIDAVYGMMDPTMLAVNGGMWFLGLPDTHRRYTADQFKDLPIAIELETADGLVGIVHADCPMVNWGDMEETLNGGIGEPETIMMCMWSRQRISSQFVGETVGVRAVVVGHTPVERWTSLGNTIYIDTGAWLPPHRGHRDFTLLDAATLQPLPPPPPPGLNWS